MTSYPSWTLFEKATEDHHGLYPLGLEPHGAAIARRLLPGITNVTVHIRYYSFLSWVFWTFEERYRRGGGNLTSRDQRQWRVRLENIHRAATRWRFPKLTGVVGVNEVIDLRDLDDNDDFDAALDGAATPFQAAFYKASFQILRCGLEQNRVVALTGLGRRLATAFDQDLSSVPDGRRARAEILGGKNRVSVRAVRTLADALALRPVSLGSAEHQGLIEMLFRFEPYAPNDPSVIPEGRRCRCLGLLLDLLRQSKGELRSAGDLFGVFASGRFSDGTSVRVLPVFEQEFAAWQRFQERQHEKLGLYGLWEDALAVLRRRSPSATGGEDILQHVWESISVSEASKDWLGESPLAMSVGDAMSRVMAIRNQLSRRTISPIHDLATHLLSRKREAGLAGPALIILLLALGQWREARQGLTPEQRRVHDSQTGRNRVVMGWLLGETEARSQLDLGQYVRWLVERCVLDQANRVALDKFTAGQFRFFILRDSDGYRLIRDQGAGAYMGYDSSRFASAYRLLAGLNLVNLENGWRITPAGGQVLKRVITHHSPK